MIQVFRHSIRRTQDFNELEGIFSFAKSFDNAKEAKKYIDRQIQLLMQYEGFHVLWTFSNYVEFTNIYGSVRLVADEGEYLMNFISDKFNTTVKPEEIEFENSLVLYKGKLLV